jgi:hypothetical protein
MSPEPQSPEAELARLADGSLSSQRQDELRTEVQGSPSLTAALADQERAVALIRSTDEITAPASLRATLEGLSADPATSAPAPRRRRWRPRLALGLAGAVTVAAAAVIAIFAVGGGASAPTLPQTAHLALAASTMAAPTESPADHDDLTIKVDGIPFPYWHRTVGWQADGQRSDSLGGRRVVTVFYTGAHDSRVGYSIVSGAPLAVHGGSTVLRHGTQYTLQSVGNARLVTWRRNGHTCVIAGHRVNDKTLLALASAESRPTATT